MYRWLGLLDLNIDHGDLTGSSWLSVIVAGRGREREIEDALVAVLNGGKEDWRRKSNRVVRLLVRSGIVPIGEERVVGGVDLRLLHLGDDGLGRAKVRAIVSMTRVGERHLLIRRIDDANVSCEAIIERRGGRVAVVRRGTSRCRRLRRISGRR